MIDGKVIVLSGDNKSFNQQFLKRFYHKAKEIRLLTDEIFDKSYDDYEKIKLFSNVDDLKKALSASDYVLHFVSQEIDLLKAPASYDEYSFNSEKLIKSALECEVSKLIMISDGTTTMANDKMLKNLSIKYAKRATKTSINYCLVKDASAIELVDTVIFNIKTANNGDIFIKKVEQKQTFANRLKNLLSPLTKIEKERGSFLTGDEMAHTVDFGNYYKVVLDDEKYQLNIFAERLKSMKIKDEELEEV